MAATNEEARNALLKLGERSVAQRRVTGTIVGIRGRQVVLALDGEGSGTVMAYRGAFEPAIGAGVTAERIAGSTIYKVDGVRDNALMALDERPYDFELQGTNLFYPLTLEALNLAAYNLEDPLSITVYNAQFTDILGAFVFIESQTIDMTPYLPVSNSVWAIIYADPNTSLLAVAVGAETATPDGEWPDAVNDLLAANETAIPLLAVWLDAGMASWGNAWKVLKRGYSFAGKRVVRIMFDKLGELTGGGGGGVSLPVSDATALVYKAADETALVRIDASAVSAGQTRVIVMPDRNVSFPLNNDTATTNPTITDDAGDGYEVGSRWINTTLGYIFINEDATLSAAVWKQIYPAVTDWGSPSAPIGGVAPVPVTATTLTVTGNAGITGDLTVDDVTADEVNAVTVNAGTLNVTGNGDIDGDLQIGDDLTVIGSSTLGTTTASNLHASNTFQLPAVAPAAINARVGVDLGAIRAYIRGQSQAIVTRLTASRLTSAITNTTTATRIHDAVIPITDLNVNSQIDIKIAGQIINTSGASRQGNFTLRMGGSVIHTSEIVLANGHSDGFDMDMTLQVLSTGLTGAIIGSSKFASGTVVDGDSEAASTAKDTTVSQNIEVYFQWGFASTGLTLAIHNFRAVMYN